MKHSIEPFPYGAREGELVVRVTDVAGQDPADIAGELHAVYQRTSMRELWLDVLDVAGAGVPRTLGLELRKAWSDIIVTGPVEAEMWPWFPVRLVVDMSSFLADPIGDTAGWLDRCSKQVLRNPPPAEIVVIDPNPGALHGEALFGLETLAQPAEGCTLYVAEDALALAVVASARAQRSWAVRRLTALPEPLRGRARAASTAA